MTVNELKVGDILYSISDASWLVKGGKYEITEVNDTEIVLQKGLHWPKNSVHEHFTLVIH